MIRIKHIRQLVWLVSTIKNAQRITLRDLNGKWVDEEIADGNPLARTSFNRYRDEIFDLFGLVMECDNEHRYYFDNPHAIDDHSINS